MKGVRRERGEEESERGLGVKLVIIYNYLQGVRGIRPRFSEL